MKPAVKARPRYQCPRADDSSQKRVHLRECAKARPKRGRGQDDYEGAHSTLGHHAGVEAAGQHIKLMAALVKIHKMQPVVRAAVLAHKLCDGVCIYAGNAFDPEPIRAECRAVAGLRRVGGKS